MSHIAIWKYYDEKMRYYFNEGGDQPTYVDRIIINEVPEFPTFDKKVENNGGLLEYSSGSFRIRLSLTQTETSSNGDTIREFLFPETRPNKFLVQVYFNDSCHFAGFFTTGDGTQALTYSEGDLYVDVQVIGCLREFADSYSLATQGTRLVPASGTYTLELYLTYHFDTHLTWSFEFPSTTYRDRIGSSTMAFSNVMQNDVNALTKFNNINRWETFNELAKGLGFNYKLEFESPSQTLTQRPDFKFKIFWIPDIEAETAITLDVKSHDIEYSFNNKEWLFIPQRYATINYQGFGNKDNYQGVAFNKTDSISISYPENPISWVEPQLQPAFLYVDGEDNFVPKNTLMFKDPEQVSGFAQPRYFNLDSEVQIPSFEFYNHGAIVVFVAGATRFLNGAITYAGFFVDSNFSHKPCQDYLVETYKRYLLGDKEVKSLDVIFTGTEGIDLYKRVELESKNFYISEINSINLHAKTASIKLTEL